MGVLDLVGVAAKGAKKAAPFFSKADVVLDELPRTKGLGNEFLGELVKKGAKPTELRERGIEKALKDKPKMTKAEVQKIFEEKAAPKVQEKVLSSDVPDYDEWLENKAQEIYGVDWFDLRKDEQKALEKMYGALELTQYDQYKTPGGENYREILLKLPSFNSKRLMELEADIRRSEGAYKDPMSMPDFRAKLEELAQLKERQAAAGTPYTSGHYRNDPNLLAHIRVQDFIVNAPPEIRHVAFNKKSGFPTQDFATQEELIEYIKTLPENIQNSLVIKQAKVAKPSKKVLLVDEIQSDWHQEGRKAGYASEDRPIRMSGEVIDLGDKTYGVKWQDGSVSDVGMGLSHAQRLAETGKLTGVVPDAPFKKNWHELSMKRILDYAAENGYDSVAITPGAEQAKRYDLSKQVDELLYKKNPDGTYQLSAQAGGRGNMMGEAIPAEKLEDYVGKEVAEKIISNKGVEQNLGGPGSVSQPKDVWGSLSGLDLQVGGEGMKGFYDKILPDYLNNYGKKYGASVVDMDMITQPERFDFAKPYAAFRETIPAESMRVHSFDITPQMREEITTKGQPIYGKVAMPALEGLAAGSGAATIGSQVFDENNEQQVQNPVHFTENPDAMLLELMQRN